MKLIKFPRSNVETKGCEKAPGIIEEHLLDFMRRKNLFFEIEEIRDDNSVKGLFSEKEFLICLGGDHSITYDLFKNFKKQNPGMLIFDSHVDAQLEEKSQKKEHENYLKRLIREGHVESKNIVIVGLRNLENDELSFLHVNRIKYFDMRRLHDDSEAFDSVMEQVREFGALYISIDIDVVDPAFAPGTNKIEPGGFTSREFLHLISRLRNLRNIKAVDIVEVNPERDINNMTSRLAANVVYEFLQ
ncbi:MAG: arginase family protein [Nanoarchaeota archaeon]|nr:arginase family protein [Nanoarchaeota archaeon]